MTRSIIIEHIDHKGRPTGDSIDARSRRAADVATATTRSWGRALVESAGYRDHFAEAKSGSQIQQAVGLSIHRPPPDEVKNIMELTSTASSPDRQYANPTPLPRRVPRVRDLLFPGSTKGSPVEYLTQTIRTNNAAPVVEGGVIPESQVGYGIGVAPVGYISTFITCSRVLFDDSDQVIAAVDGELTYALQYVEDFQLLYGPGTTGFVQGIISQATPFSAPYTIQGATNADVLLQALYQASQAEVQPDGIVLNTGDYLKLLQLKDSTGRYVIGNPGGTGDDAPTLWGKPVVATNAMAAGQFLVGAFQTVTIYDREEITIEVATQDQSDFEMNQVKIRAAERAALAVRRPQALITGALPNPGALSN